MASLNFYIGRGGEDRTPVDGVGDRFNIFE